MSSVSIQGNASGTGIFTIASPNSNTNRTLTLPDATGTINTSGAVNEVPAGSASAPSIYPAGDTNTGIFFPAADTIAFAEGGAEVARFNSSGNFGIGTTSPAYQLDINNASSYSTIGLRQGGTLYGYIEGGSSQVKLGTNGAIPMLFEINGTERARINTNGNLLVGTTAAGAGVGYETRIAASRDSDCAIFKYVSGPGGATSAYPLYAWNTADSGNNNFQAFLTDTSPIAERGKIDYNRGAGQVRYNTTSDATFKNIIGDADGQKSVEILNSTRIREFAWKDDTTQKPQIGVIAQELYETFKGAVSVGGDVEKTDEEGNVTTKYNPWGVDKTAFTFHLVAGWQAHEKMIAEQQAKIDALEARLAALEAK
jgi:hypothetical protein